MIPFSNFTSYRPGQLETIQQVTNSESKYNIISAPTGIGKSLISMMICDHFTPSLMTVSTKMLQEQLLHDYPEAVILKGRNNYPCPRFAEWDLMADSCVKKGCEDVGDCPYEQAKMAALNSKYRVFNLSYLLYETNLAMGLFSNQDTIIIDEADHLEQQLVEFISLELGKRDQSLLESYNLLDPEYFTKPDTWKEWAIKCLIYLSRDLKHYESLLKSCNIEVIKSYRQIKRLHHKMSILSKYADHNWIRYAYDNKITYKPIWLNPELSKEFLFRHASRWVFMSATFPEFSIYCRLLGINQTESQYIELPSPFPIEHRPIHYEPIADMSYKSQRDSNAVDIMLAEIKGLLDKYKDVKGIIHSTSYALNTTIMSIGNKRLITHNSQDKEDVITRFKQSTRPYVLVSPSIERGVSFDDDLCRFIIIPKVPYQSTQDRIVSSRLYSGDFGQEWYMADAAQRIVQMSGRGVRSDIDHCDTYILDSNFTKLIQRPRLFSAYFREAIQF